MSTHELPKSWFQMLKQTVMEWSEDRASTLAAALTYTAIFSLAPIVVIAVFVAGLVLGKHGGARQTVHDQIAGFVGSGAADFMDKVIDATYKSAASGKAAWFTAISVLVLVYAATNLFTTLQDSLNVIWHVERHPKTSWFKLIRDRLVTFVMVAIIGFLLLASVVLSTYLSAITGTLGGLHPAIPRIIEAVVSIAVFTGVFALILKYLPDAVVEWNDVLVGALFTAVLFTLGKYALGLYLTRAGTASAFGAAGSLVVLMLFIYYSSQIFFLGAKFTSVYARRTGSPIRPGKNAACVEDVRRFKAEEKVKAGLTEKDPEPFEAKPKRVHGTNVTLKSRPLPLRPAHDPREYNAPGFRRA